MNRQVEKKSRQWKRLVKSYLLFFTLLFLFSCLDRIDIPIPEESSHDLIVEGQITDEPGPYTIKLTKAIKIDGPLVIGASLSAKRVTIYDNVGNTEVLEEKEMGTYQTHPEGMQGIIGREYHIRIEMLDGKIFESSPDKMSPAGELDTVYYEFESMQRLDAPTEYGYRIYADATGLTDPDYFLRWKFKGTYVIETLPKFRRVAGPFCPPCGCLIPPPCADQCECCRCWVTDNESRPKITSNRASKNGYFPKVEVGYVPINFYTFYDKYRVEITQMSLSKTAYEYWSSVDNQKEATGSLFQPINGKIRTNIFEVNGGSGVQGLFYASAVKKKEFYLNRTTHRVEIREPVNCDGRIGAAGVSCLTFPNSTNQQPDYWK